MVQMLEISAMGYLGKDPEIRSTQNGEAFTSFSMACTKRWNDRSGQKQEKTTWLRVTAWGKPGETMAILARQGAMKSGSLVFVRGEPSLRSYTDRNGGDQVSLDVKVEFFQLLNSGKNASEPDYQPPDDDDTFQLPTRQSQSQPQQSTQPTFNIDF